MKQKNEWELHLAEQFPSICSDIRCGAYAPTGWKPEIEKHLQYIEIINLKLGDIYQVDQIKTKFGSLRLYVGRKTPRDPKNPEYLAENLVFERMARYCELIVDNLCSKCGEYCRRTDDMGYRATTCDSCLKEVS